MVLKRPSGANQTWRTHTHTWGCSWGTKPASVRLEQEKFVFVHILTIDIAFRCEWRVTLSNIMCICKLFEHMQKREERKRKKEGITTLAHIAYMQCKRCERAHATTHGDRQREKANRVDLSTLY